MGLKTGRGPMEGGGPICDLCMCGMRYLGELTKLCTYDFRLCFRYFGFQTKELGMVAGHTHHMFLHSVIYFDLMMFY